jgi:hypothetical protein
MSINKRVMGRLKKIVRSKTSFDGYCPACRENIGWKPLAILFNDKVFDAERTFRSRFVCPQCDCVLQVEMQVDFQLTEVG